MPGATAFVDELSFLAPVISLSIISARYLPEKSGESMFKSLKQGIHFIWRQGAMVALMIPFLNPFTICLSGSRIDSSK